MRRLMEIYLTSSFVSTNDWAELIKTITRYHNFLQPWQIIVVNNRNQIRYFVRTGRVLPATINQSNRFLLKPVTDLSALKYHHVAAATLRPNQNILDLVNYYAVKNKGTLTFLEINFQKTTNARAKAKINFYLNKNQIVTKYRTLFAQPEKILSIDFANNQRFCYKSASKYLEINKVLPLLSSDTNQALLQIDTFPYLQDKLYLPQNNFDFAKHSIILGSSGCGKSKFISSLVYNLYQDAELMAKYKIVVIDPHAALEDDIGGIGKVIDFMSTLDGIDLFVNDSENTIAATELLLDLFKSLLAAQYNSKLERVLRHAIHLLLLDDKFNFHNLRKLILELDFRNELINKLKPELPASVIDFFLADFNTLKTKSYNEAISPIIGFIDEMEMLPIFNATSQSVSLQQTIQDNFLTLFSLDRTKLGDKVTKTIAGLIMQQLLDLVQKRKINEHIIFIIDEVAVLENPILARYLSEARKYNLSLILAGQYFSQISDTLKNSIFANVINYFIFRVSKLDANILVDNFDIKIPLDNSREQKLKLLTSLNNRECVARISANETLRPACRGKTLDYVSQPRIRITIDKRDNVTSSSKSILYTFKLDCNITPRELLKLTSTSRKALRDKRNDFNSRKDSE